MSKRAEWTEAELQALEDPECWDWETFEQREPAPLRAVRFVVRLPIAEAREIGRAARAAGLTELEYLRAAALEKARTETPTPTK
jgi:hypothetical protein